MSNEYYSDLTEYLNALQAKDKLYRIKRKIIKETELTPLVRLQYRGLPESQRKGFLFENVYSIKGNKYEIPVATGIYASSTEIYALGLGCDISNQENLVQCINNKWEEGLLHPIETEQVAHAPSQEIIIEGEKLLEDGNGIELLPIPVELPGFSGQIRTTNEIITKDPETGIQNMGVYSGHVFGKTKILWEINRGNHGWIHYNKWKQAGKKEMPAAIIIGGVPLYFYVGAAKVPYGVDELTVAGGIIKRAIKVVKAKTVDLMVPADADIIIEGLVSLEYMEPGNAFGEYTGYMATDVWERPIFNITAITMKRNPVFVHVMSQMPPSESSKVRKISSDNLWYKFLKYSANIPGIIDVSWHEISQGQLCVIKIKKINNSHPWQVLYLAASYDMRWGKYFIVVDDDIDIHSMDSVIWALAWRVQPATDIKIIDKRIPGLDPSAYKPNDPYEEKVFPKGVGSSAVLIDATRKHPYPPVALPRKEYMERALEIWKELNLPKLNLVSPWYGYELGYWPEEFKEDAENVVKGEHYKVGERLAKGRKKV
jgi:4-hydroxy-3-polyprenylbenzoate decarboxylase